MRVASVFERAFTRIYGKPCWRVSRGYGSFLTFEFGSPRLVVREPIAASKSAAARVRARLAQRRVVVRGDWHLWIYCCEWEVFNRGTRVGDSSATAKIRRAIDFLDGQKLIQFSILPRKIGCVFRFDLGGVLRTNPYDKESEQWILYEPSQKALVLRGDGYFKHTRSDMPEDSGTWNRIVSA
jgi:hypothetical protein